MYVEYLIVILIIQSLIYLTNYLEIIRIRFFSSKFKLKVFLTRIFKLSGVNSPFCF